MSLNRTLRTIESVAKEVERAAAAGEREVAGMRKQLGALDAKLATRPITTLGLSFQPSTGLHADPIEISSGSMSMTIGPIDMDLPSNEFKPASYDEDGVTVEPLGLYTSTWFTVVPVRISNSNSDFRPKLNWVKKTDRSSSSIFLLDVENSEYYYPLDTDFTGEVLEGHPRVGIFVFEKFRLPTTRVELHLSGVRLSDIGPANLKFTLEGEDLADQIAGELTTKSFVERFDDELTQQRATQEAASGCSVVALLLGAGTIAAAALAAGLA
jgi:hypothetical protein